MVRPDAVLQLMGRLAVIRPVFHSEADFQHALAWEVQQAHPSLRVRLETRPRPGIHLDLLVSDPADRTGVAVELKYRTDRWVGDFDGEHFALLGHSARDVSGYDILKDVSRIERMVKDEYVTSGVAIALSNDPGYWQPPTFGRTTNADAFRIHEGLSVTGIREWGPDTGAGTMAGREAPIVLTGEYPLRWQDYSDLRGHHGRFR